jgi:hypothetical protein
MPLVLSIDPKVTKNFKREIARLKKSRGIGRRTT